MLSSMARARDRRRPVLVVEFAKEAQRRTFDRILPEQFLEDRLRIDPLDLSGLADRVVPVPEQATHWAASLVASGGPPRAVLAYCSGAVFAEHLAAALPGDDTVLVVLDPAFPGPEDAEGLLSGFAAAMGAPNLPVPAIAGLPDQQALETAGAFLREALACVAPDLDAVVADELTADRRIWLSFVLSAARARANAPRRPAHVVLSEGATPEAADFRSVHRMPESVTGLFASADVRDLLAGMLETVPSC
ncbi:hypothetical protein N566_04805 [Streptomycetaceae bacterium MP113-05]|nr:hypothetical protein N566_04805 [Streptomycetaceae bacterium MP113-05]